MKEKEFSFQVDRKHTVWVREDIEVKASNIEEAKEKLTNLITSGQTGDQLNSFKILEDTLELMTVEENGNWSVTEALHEGDTFFYDGDE